MALKFGNTPKKGIFDGLFTDENIASLLKRSEDNIPVKFPMEGSPSIEDDLKSIFAKARENPLSTKKLQFADGEDAFSGLGTTTALAGNWMADNKLKTAGLAGTGLMNLAGLFDNDKIIGQLLGGAGGFAAGKLLPGVLKANPLTGSGLALAVMGGGALGSLFDKLMAKKAEEEAAMQAAYAGQY